MPSYDTAKQNSTDLLPEKTWNFVSSLFNGDTGSHYADARFDSVSL